MLPRIHFTMSSVDVPGVKTSRMPAALETWDVVFGDNAAAEHLDVISAFLFQQFRNSREQGIIVGAGEDRQTDAIDVFLNGGSNDLLRESGAGRCR